MVPVFLLFLACCDVRAVLLLRGIRGRWSLGLLRTNLNEGFSTKKMPEIRRWFLMNYFELCLIFHPILRVTYEGTDIVLIKFTGKP
jgi:hypothetical protein